MSLYIVKGRGSGATRTIWIPGDPGQPNHADSKDELLAWSPRPGSRPCSNAECAHFSQVYPHAPYGRWQWANGNFCRRCFDLRRYHGMELPELIALWEAQDRRCFQCSEMLTDPRLPSEGKGPSSYGPDGTWRIRIDHDHKICPTKRSHSCERCRRGLVCTPCNCHPLSIRSTGSWILPESDDNLRRWLEFLGPGDRDRLRQALTLFPEQPICKPSRRRPDSSETGAVLFNLDDFREPA